MTNNWAEDPDCPYRRRLAEIIKYSPKIRKTEEIVQRLGFQPFLMTMQNSGHPNLPPGTANLIPGGTDELLPCGRPIQSRSEVPFLSSSDLKALEEQSSAAVFAIYTNIALPSDQQAHPSDQRACKYQVLLFFARSGSCHDFRRPSR